MRPIKNILLYRFILAAMVCFSLCNVAHSQIERRQRPIVPIGFEGARVGMSLKDLVAKRKDLVEGMLTRRPIDLKVPDHLLFENISQDTFFQIACYGVESSKVQIISFAGTYETGISKAKVDSFLEHLLQSFQKPHSISIGEIDRIHPDGVMCKWYKDDVMIAAMFPNTSTLDTSKLASIQLFFFSREFLTAKKARLSLPPKRSHKALLAPTENLIDQIFPDQKGKWQGDPKDKVLKPKPKPTAKAKASNPPLPPGVQPVSKGSKAGSNLTPHPN